MAPSIAPCLPPPRCPPLSDRSPRRRAPVSWLTPLKRWDSFATCLPEIIKTTPPSSAHRAVEHIPACRQAVETRRDGFSFPLLSPRANLSRSLIPSFSRSASLSDRASPSSFSLQFSGIFPGFLRVLHSFSRADVTPTTGFPEIRRCPREISAPKRCRGPYTAPSSR